MIIAIQSRNNAVFSGFNRYYKQAMLDFMKKSHENTAILLGRRIRSLRNVKGWSQQELGNEADINYKFLGEIERGQKNPSFNILVKIALALEVDLPELFQFEHEILNREKIESQIEKILKTMADDDLRQILLVLRVLYPVRSKVS